MRDFDLSIPMDQTGFGQWLELTNPTNSKGLVDKWLASQGTTLAEQGATSSDLLSLRYIADDFAYWRVDDQSIKDPFDLYVKDNDGLYMQSMHITEGVRHSSIRVRDKASSGEPDRDTYYQYIPADKRWSYGVLIKKNSLYLMSQVLHRINHQRMVEFFNQP